MNHIRIRENLCSPLFQFLHKNLPLLILLSQLSYSCSAFFQECLGILVARCASCNCMTYFYCASLQVNPPADTSLFLTTYRGGSHLQYR
ncbi:hypothetical protein DXC93_13895 [Dorea formicigenerans]|uniref:Uncharacterized protein n=1 Tax=Dorea formicigenerans TaxID=39486 RepID=A0A3E4PJW0_9FIRM|nr:hypothetical protein DXC93_13895 [Dorea formicigenerans]